MISLIVAADEHGGMGKDNQLLCHLPADLHYFKNKTLGKPIIMGRKTFESIGRVLPERLNIILTRRSLSITGAVVATSLEDALAKPSDYPEVMIIGGANLFEQAYPLAQRIYLTRIHHQFDADVFFSTPDENEWTCIERQNHPADAKNPYAMTFYIYDRQSSLHG